MILNFLKRGLTNFLVPIKACCLQLYVYLSNNVVSFLSFVCLNGVVLSVVTS